jgi:hypothetical protein
MKKLTHHACFCTSMQQHKITRLKFSLHKSNTFYYRHLFSGSSLNYNTWKNEPMHLTAHGRIHNVTQDITIPCYSCNCIYLALQTILCRSKILMLVITTCTKPCTNMWGTLTLVTVLTSCVFWVIFQLRQQEACQYLFPCFLIKVCLKLQHGLSLILRQPHSFQIQVCQWEW